MNKEVIMLQAKIAEFGVISEAINFSDHTTGKQITSLIERIGKTVETENETSLLGALVGLKNLILDITPELEQSNDELKKYLYVILHNIKGRTGLIFKSRFR